MSKANETTVRNASWFPVRWALAALALAWAANLVPARAAMDAPLATRLTADVVAHLFPEGERLDMVGEGPPLAAVEAGGEVIGYLFSTHETVHPRGYSGQSFDIVVGLGSDGVIRGHLVLEEHEPLVGPGMIEPEAVNRYLDQTHGFDLKVQHSFLPEHVDGVSGATISVVAMRRAVVSSAILIGYHAGVVDDSGGLGLDRFGFAPRTWPELIADGSVRALSLTNGEVRAAFAEAFGADAAPEVPLGEDAAPFLTLYAALATPPTVGRNLFGGGVFANVTEVAMPGDHQLMIGTVGGYKWAPRNPYMVDAFDRARIVQGATVLPLATGNYSRASKLAADGAPAFDFVARFALPGESGFDPLAPWAVEIDIVAAGGGDGPPRRLSFQLPYRVPAAYVRGDLVALEDAGFREPTYAAFGLWRESTLSDWQQLWLGKQGPLLGLALLLAAVTAVMLFQHRLARARRLYQAVRIALLAATLVWLGWIAGGQVTILTVISYLQAALGTGDWQVILLDPVLVIVTAYVGLTLVLWGRGVFCGWLCPFGALQELLNRLARLARVPQLAVPESVQQRLWSVKYILGVAIIGTAGISISTATAMAEVEPFLTAITMGFARTWPYLIWPVALLVAGLFVERFFCRYLCPLGGVLAVLGRFHMLNWLVRRPECGNPCQICTHSCPIGAISAEGPINMNECLQCLDCQVDAFDHHRCPPLIVHRRRAEAAPASL